MSFTPHDRQQQRSFCQPGSSPGFCGSRATVHYFEALTALWCAQFSTFAERINSIDIDVLHRIGQTEEAPDQGLPQLFLQCILLQIL